MNLNSTVIPKSDQLNADDLIAGPRTITISAVEQGSSDQQPINIRYDGDGGRPYKPSKGMRRVLIVLWGSEGNAYARRKLTLFCDPSVTYGVDTTGGIRISHASDIAGPVEIALTIKRGKKKMFHVYPLPAIAPSFDIAAIIEGGCEAAKLGTARLREWWTDLPATARSSLKQKLDGEWKRTAEESDKQTASDPGA